MSRIGKYELVRRLATGGMAEVFLAKTGGALDFEKTVVVKRIRQHLLDDPQFLQMFLQEAKLAAQLNHPNIAQVFDFGESEGEYFLAMEYVDGPNLRALATEAHKAGKPIPYPLCAKIVSYACEGLAFAHELVNPATQKPLGIVHRDISPDNIVLDRNGAVKVVDFGIAKAAEQLFQTQSGLRKGKLAYMSPEYVKGLVPDRRADVFALGVVLYELIANKKPYDAESEVTLMHAMIYDPMVPIRARRSDVPEALEEILDRALMRNRDARYPSCRELQADLERYIVGAGEPLTSVHISRAIAALQPELDAATLAKTQGRVKSTPSGKTPPKKAAVPPQESPDRTWSTNGPKVVVKAAAVYGDGPSTEATVLIPAHDVGAGAVTPVMPMPVVGRKVEPRPAPERKREPEPEDPEKAKTILEMRVVAPPAPAKPPPSKPSVPSRPSGLVVTQRQLMAAGAAILGLMLLSAGLAMVFTRRSEPPPPPPAEKVEAEVVTPPPEPPPEPPQEQNEKQPEPPPKPQEEPRVALEITSNVPATVKIGKRKGKATPYRNQLPPGKYDVELDDPVTGFWMKRFPIELKLGTPARFSITIGKGTVLVMSPGVDASVYVDQDAQPRDKTSARLTLNEGQHRIRVASPKKPAPYEEPVEVVADQEKRVVARFP